MNQTQLYLNDQLADLSDDHPIALTFQINDLAEVKNQQGNTSNQFKLPLTQNNRIILGYADDISFCDSTLVQQIPYTRLSSRVIQNGIEILPNAIAEINEVDDDTASITILSGNVDFFDALGGQIADMGDKTSQWSNYGTSLLWEPFNHTWNLYNVANSQNNTEQDGWIYPIVDYGLLSLTDFTQIDVRNQRPGFFIKKAIDLLVQSTGYTATGSLLADPLYPLLIAQFSNSSWDHGVDYQNTPTENGLATVKGNNTYLGNASGYIPFNAGNNFDGINYLASDSVKGTITVVLNFYMLGHPGGYTGNKNATLFNVNISILRTNGSIELPGSAIYNFDANYTKVGGEGNSLIWYETFTNQKISADVELSQGDVVNISYSIADLSQTQITVFAASSLTFLPDQASVLFGQPVQCERILPDMSQKDFLKDTFQRFGIICQTDVYNKTINFASLRDIINNIPVANDWTTKCVDHGKQITYKLGNYAQVNNMEYQTDPNILPLKFGWDQLMINDQTLDTVPTDLIVSKFGPSINRPYIGGTIAQIAMIDITTDDNAFSVSVAPRILVDQKIDLRDYNNATITFSDGINTPIVVNDIISVPYFYKSDGEYNLCWCDKDGLVSGQQIPGLKTKYYSDLQKILQNTKVLVRYILLTPRDIAELNLLVPVYLQQHNAYFYINKIDSWRKGQPCKVELVRIG